MDDSNEGVSVINRQKGMTLIEILIVVLVVSVGMAATAKFQGDLLQSGANTKARTQALTHAQEAVESLRINHSAAANGKTEDIAGSGAEYDLEWTVSDVGSAKQYTASVIWKDRQDKTQSVQLDTLLYADSMIGSDTADDEVRAKAAYCVFVDCGSGTNNTPPQTNLTIDLESEGVVEVPNENPVESLDVAEDGLSAVGKKQTQLTGNDYINKLNGSGDYKATGGNDKFLVMGKANGSISLEMGAGNDIVQIDEKLNGSATIDLGAGDDWLILHDFTGSAKIIGGDGIDIICFSGLSGLSGKSQNINGVEILLFNNGTYQFANGYSTDPSNIPIGCGSGGSSSFVYQYPVTVELVFPTEESAERDSVADVINNTALEVIENEHLIALPSEDNAYQLLLGSVSTTNGSGENEGKYVKTLSFTLQSSVSLASSDDLNGCASWQGEGYTDLKITLQSSPCE